MPCIALSRAHYLFFYCKIFHDQETVHPDILLCKKIYNVCLLYIYMGMNVDCVGDPGLATGLLYCTYISNNYLHCPLACCLMYKQCWYSTAAKFGKLHVQQ